MATEHIVKVLTAERDKLNAAIAALAGETKRRGRPPGSGRKATSPVTSNGAQPASTEAPVRRKRRLSAAGRAAIVAAAKKRWRAIRAGKARSPFAGRKSAKRKTA